MSASLPCLEECICICGTQQMESHIGAVQILHAVAESVAEYLKDKGDADGMRLAAALLNVNRLLRGTVPADALANQQWSTAFTTVSDVALSPAE